MEAMTENDDSRGFLISFEGSEGSGKSTQISRIANRFEDAGYEVIVTREPGGTAIGEEIRHILMHADEADNMMPETELLLFAASRAQLVREVILPAVAAGKIVLCDRFMDSTTVYQGVARAIDPFETATELETVQSRLETLYTITSRASRLSLVNFLS